MPTLYKVKWINGEAALRCVLSSQLQMDSVYPIRALIRPVCVIKVSINHNGLDADIHFTAASCLHVSHQPSGDDLLKNKPFIRSSLDSVPHNPPTDQ